jgi:Protein of unknown function (DUF2934)
LQILSLGVADFFEEIFMELLITKPKKRSSPIPVIGMETMSMLNCEDVDTRVAIRAYYKAEARGYEPGHEIQDWLDAEAEVIAEIETEQIK